MGDPMTLRRTALWLAALVMLVGSPAWAQLPDPTRPPPDAYTLSGSASEVAPAATVAAGPQLQSVLLSRKPGGRQLAVIDGVTVPLGGKVGSATLVEIRSGSVVLQRGSRKQILKLAGAGPVTRP
jgi:MSHA biogenesis protein MshK